MCKNTGCNTCNGNCGCNCNSCCNNDCNNCNEQPCGCPFEVDFACVRYTGNELSCLDLSEGETLEQLVKRLDELLCNLSPGVDGENGDSAYQIWLNLGNEGTEEDFMSYLSNGLNKEVITGISGFDSPGIVVTIPHNLSTGDFIINIYNETTGAKLGDNSMTIENVTSTDFDVRSEIGFPLETTFKFILIG